jgi:hypothetical protein
MASAPPPPMNVKLAGAVTPDTVLSWSASPGVPAAGYRVHWRDTTEAAWTHARDAGNGNGNSNGNSVTLANVAIDDFAFGVAGVSGDGFESPVVFPGAAGAFWAGR